MSRRVSLIQRVIVRTRITPPTIESHQPIVVPTTTNGGINPKDQGLGVKTATIDTNFTQGGLQTTGINTDLAINGDGFFILKNIDGTGIPQYTRDGHFSRDRRRLLPGGFAYAMLATIKRLQDAIPQRRDFLEMV